MEPIASRWFARDCNLGSIYNSIDLKDRGIDETQAADLRSQLGPFTEDWDRPGDVVLVLFPRLERVRVEREAKAAAANSCDRE